MTRYSLTDSGMFQKATAAAAAFFTVVLAFSPELLSGWQGQQGPVTVDSVIVGPDRFCSIRCSSRLRDYLQGYPAGYQVIIREWTIPRYYCACEGHLSDRIDNSG